MRELSVDWLQPLAAPTIIDACGPRRISAAISTMYDSDMFEPLAIGNWTLNAENNDESRTRKSRGRTGWKVPRLMKTAKVTAPSAMSDRIYQRARGGRSRSKSAQV